MKLIWTFFLLLFGMAFGLAVPNLGLQPLTSTFGYDDRTQTSIPYDQPHASAFDYDSVSVSITKERENSTVGTDAVFTGFAEFVAAEGTRALKLPATRGMAPGVLGETLPNGQVFLRPGLSRAEQVSTLRHESVHAFFSPRGSGPVATFRQNLGQWGYDNSQLLRFTEEAMAETYGSGSLLQGLRHPLLNGYGITTGGLLLEGGAVGGGIFGAGYLGYQLGGGN